MQIETTQLSPARMGVNESIGAWRTRLSPDEPRPDAKRISVVTGTHGDELEGQYVCYELIRRIREAPRHLTGIVDVYPAVNPLGIDSIMRGIPNFDLDMNRLFPGRDDGSMPERYAKTVMQAVSGSDLALDIHASNVFLYEIPQIRINELTVKQLMAPALMANVDYIWVHGAATVLEATLAHSLNMSGTPCLVVEMGIGMRLTKSYGDQLVDGIFNLMASLGIWAGPHAVSHMPRVSTDGKVQYVNAGVPGVFMPVAQHTDHVEEGEVIGHILSPLTGEAVETLTAPATGLMFTLRAYPMVYEGALIARILADAEEGER